MQIFLFNSCTCSGGVGRLEEAHDSFGVEARRAQQDGLGSRVPPADDGESVLTVATADPLDGRVRDALRHNQQAWVADWDKTSTPEAGIHNFSIRASYCVYEWKRPKHSLVTN